MTLARIVANMATIISYETISISVILNITLLVEFVISLLASIVGAKISLVLAILCSSIDANPITKSAIVFAKYTMLVNDHFWAFGLHEKCGVLA